MNIGLFDMDGSLADYEGQLRTDLEQTMTPQERYVYKDVNIWKLDSLPHYRHVMRLIKAQAGWWQKLPKLENGIKVFNLAKEIGFENHILTKGPKWYPEAWKEKVIWCQETFGKDIDIHITSDKGLVYGKFLYDDYPDYMLRWLTFRPRGLGIMPTNDNNRDFTHPQVIKYYGDNLDEVMLALKTCFNRKVKTI